MIKNWKRVISIVLVIAMVMQVSHMEDYRYIGEVFAAPADKSVTEATKDSKQQEDTEYVETDNSEDNLTGGEQDNISQDDSTETIQEDVSEESTQVLQEGLVEEAVANAETNSDILAYETLYNWQELVVENGEISDDYEWKVPYKLTSDVTIRGDLIIKAPLNLNGYSLTVEGDVYQYVMSVVNGDLLVEGDYLWQAGDIIFDEGHLSAKGNFSALAGCTAKLYMQNAVDKMTVFRNVELDVHSTVTTDITAGTIELKGDFLQKTDFVEHEMVYSDGDFRMEEESTLLLSGDANQNIYISKETSDIQRITVDTSSLEKDKDGNYIFHNRQIGFSGLCNYEVYEDFGCPTTYGYAVRYEIPEENNGYIYGSCYYDGEEASINGYTLTVIGDFIQNSGVHTNGAYLYVTGDYRIQSIDAKDEYGETDGFIDVSQGGAVYVYGDFYTQSMVDHTGFLTNATWYNRGNFNQLGTGAKNFVTDSSFTINVGQQSTSDELHVYMENPLENPFYFFKANSNLQVHFDNGICINYGYSYDYEGFIYYTAGHSVYNGDVKIPSDVTTVGSLYAKGDITIQGDLEITGYLHAEEDIVIEEGSIDLGYMMEGENITFVDGSSTALIMEEDYSGVRCDGFYYGGNMPLSMTGEQSFISCHDFYYASNSGSGALTNGSIEFTGDFYVKDVGTGNSFVCSENHKVIAKGNDGLQHITIENTDSCIETLQVSNGSNGVTKSTEGTVIHTIDNASYSYVWEGIEGYTLEQDMTYDEDLVMYMGMLDLNGYTLTVNGDFIASKGTIDLNGGHLIVNGDMNLAYRDWSTGEPEFQKSTVDIVMNDEQDRIDIAGDFYANFRDHALNNTTAGAISLAGDMTIDGYVTNSYYASVTKDILCGTSLLLVGTKKQTISGVSTQLQLKMQNLTVNNETEIAVELPVFISGNMELSEKLTYSFYSTELDNLGGLTNGVFTGNMKVKASKLIDDIVINGALTVNGAMDLQGHALHASMIYVNEEVTLSKGEIVADTLYMYDKIHMASDEDVMKLGYFYTDVETADNDYMVDGNIYVEEGYRDYTTDSYAFLPSGEHTITFTKTDSTTETPVAIHFSNASSLLNRVVLCNLLNCYSLNREKEAVANEVILGYEDGEKPASPENVMSSDVKCFSVRLSWDEAMDDVEIYRYKVYRDGVYIGKTKTTAYVDSDLKANTTYRYTVSALDATGNESEQTEVLEVTTIVDSVSPIYKNAPEIEVKGGSVTFDCENCFVDKESYVDYYIISRDGVELARILENSKVTYKDENDETVSKQVQEGNPVFQDTGLEYGIIYEYGIQAVDFAGNISKMQTYEVIGDLPPKMPQGVTVTSENGFNIISFEMTGTKDVSYYYIYENGECVRKIYNSDARTYSYVHREVEVGETYRYFVQAYNQYLTGGECTDEIEVTTVAESTPPVISEIAYTTTSDYVNENLDVEVYSRDENALGCVYAYVVKKDEEATTEIYREEIDNSKKADIAQFTFDITGLEGEYELHTVVSDHCGNETEIVKTCKIHMGGLPVVEIIDTSVTASTIYIDWSAVEGAHHYIVERKEADGYVKEYMVKDTEICIPELICDTEYTYRIVAYDEQNARGLVMEDVTLLTSADTTIPWINNVYSDGMTLGINSRLMVSYADDVQVEKLYMYYRLLGTGEWTLISDNTVNDRRGIRYYDWNKTGLASGQYEVRYVLEDSSGNMSEELIRTYFLDLEGPGIQNFQVTPKDWAIEVSWDAFTDEDYEEFVLKRISVTQYNDCIDSNKSTDYYEVTVCLGEEVCGFSEQIAPDEEYIYKLYAYDTAGNVSVASGSGRAIDNDVIPPNVGGLQQLYAAKDYPVVLSANGCYDNDKIVSYQWSLGNGQVIYGQNCTFTYEEIGTYDVELTVWDANGNHATEQTTITVGEDVGIMKVNVVSGTKKLAGADVVACVNGNPCHSGSMAQTDSQGGLIFPIDAGTYKIAAYLDGYVPKEKEVTIKKGETKEITIDLEESDMVSASFTTREMTKAEMEAAGVDTTSNKEGFEYELILKYQSGDMEKITVNNLMGNRYYWDKDGNISTPSIQDDDDEEDDIDCIIDNVSDDPEHPIFVVTRERMIDIDWLSNVYQIEATLCNEAEEQFVIEDTELLLRLPKGLDYAQMKDGSAVEKHSIGDLAGGESVTRSWYVVGSKEGTYYYSLELSGIVQPFNRQLKKTLESQKGLNVQIGEGLHLYIYPEAEAYIGEDYYVQFKLVNESEDTYHNVTASFGAFETIQVTAQVLYVNKEDGTQADTPLTVNTGISYFMEDGTSVPTLSVGDRLTAKKLAPGKSMYGTWKFQFDASGNQNTEYYELLNNYVEHMNVDGTSVKVTINSVPSHLQKKVQEVYVPDDDPVPPPDPDPIPSEEDDNNTPPDPTETVKDPINLMTGAFTTNHMVAAVSGGTNFGFNLSYNSLYTETVGDFGKGWYHNYEMYLERMGSLVALHQNPHQVLYFAESEDTANIVCGTIEDGGIALSSDESIARTYYQTGSSNRRYRIEKNEEGYTLYSGAERYVFDTEGKLSQYVDEEGKTLSVTRNDNSLVVTDVATGKSIKATFNEEGRIVSVEDAAGKKTAFQYDGECMTALTSKNGTTLIYEYDNAGHILVGKEGDGTVYVENTFDKQGRVLTQIANGKKDEITTFSYVTDEESETTTVTMKNADGTTEQAVSDKYGQGIQYVDAIGGVKNYTYNDMYDMTSYRFADGAGMDYTYDEFGNIVKVVETTGKTTEYTYDDNNRVTRVVSNDGTDVAYTYNSQGQMTSVTSGNGLQAEYTYNENGQVLTETSSLGTIEYTYEKGMLRCLKDYTGNYHYFTYDANGNVVQYIDGAGVVTNYVVDASGRVTEESVGLEDGKSATTKYAYDGYGNLVSETDANGNTTQYVYNENDQLEKEIRPDKSTYTYSYDANGNITKIVCPDGVTTAEAVYDAAGNASSLTDTLKSVQSASYSVGGQLLNLTQPNGGEIQYTYYENGLLESQTDANGNKTTLFYDEAGRISSITDESGANTVFAYDSYGNLHFVQNALGKSVIMEYNQYRKVIRQIDANGNVTRYDYDKALNCTKVTDTEGGITEFVYDARGQITSMTKKGDTEEQDVTLSMTYDNLGNVTSLTDGEGNTQRMEYDANSNLKALYDAYGVKIEGYEYDCLGNCIKITDAFGNVTTNSYDAMGNLVKQMNESTGNAVTYSYVGGKYLASSTDALERTASATYDSMGNLSTLTNPNGGVTTYKYDLNSNLTDEIIGEDYHVRYTYNAKNLAATKTNSRGQKTSYSYDALGRIIKQEDEAGIIEYTYDSNDNVLTVTETIGEQVNTITRTFDGLNRVTSYVDAKGNRIEYGYDKIGNLVTLTYPNGKEVTYTYNRNCSISSVTDWSGRTTTYGYDKNGRLVETKRPNGTIEKREYDKAGQLTLILDKSGDTVVNRQEYSYDASGNITQVKQLYNGELDFTKVTTAKMTYDKNNRLLTYNGEEVQYDKDGNMTYGPLNGIMTDFVFDCRNRLIKAGDTSYEYDAENNRIAVTTGVKRTEYVVNTQPELSQVLQSKTYEVSKEDSAKTTYYYYGKGLLAQENSNGYLTYHFNNVGSTMAVTNSTGAVVAKYNYSPYGELLEGEYNADIPFLYNGQFGVMTDGNGLYYMRARYYNVDIKRFINQDVLMGTLERISSLNRFSYVEGNPISFLDPFGLERSIYDDWHDYLQEMMTFYTIVSMAITTLTSPLPENVKNSKPALAVAIALLIDVLWVASMDIGVCIGRAWEGVLESDYNKIDTSYRMMGEVLDSVVLAISTYLLDDWCDTDVFGYLEGISSLLQTYGG